MARRSGCTVKLLHGPTCPQELREQADWACDWLTFQNLSSNAEADCHDTLKQGDLLPGLDRLQEVSGLLLNDLIKLSYHVLLGGAIHQLVLHMHI